MKNSCKKGPQSEEKKAIKRGLGDWINVVVVIEPFSYLILYRYMIFKFHNAFSKPVLRMTLLKSRDKSAINIRYCKKDHPILKRKRYEQHYINVSIFRNFLSRDKKCGRNYLSHAAQLPGLNGRKRSPTFQESSNNSYLAYY